MIHTISHYSGNQIKLIRGRMDVSCGSTEGRYLFNPFRAWVGSDRRGGAMMDWENSGRGPAIRATYAGNRKRPQTQVKSGGCRISTTLGVNVAWGGKSGLPRARKDANSPFRCLVWSLVRSIAIGECFLRAAFFHELWLVRADPSSPRLSALLALHFLPVVFGKLRPAGASSV